MNQPMPCSATAALNRHENQIAAQSRTAREEIEHEKSVACESREIANDIGAFNELVLAPALTNDELIEDLALLAHPDLTAGAAQLGSIAGRIRRALRKRLDAAAEARVS